MLTYKERKQLEYLQAKEQRYRDNCVTCVNRKGYEPCWKANNPEVQAWLNEEGEYSDLNKCCPEWYDEC